MIHSFDSMHAEQYGLPEAIMIVSFQYWIRLNRANGRHQNDGRTWTYNSNKALAEMFPYLTEKQVRRTIDSLVEKGVLIKGNYNASAYDRTCWYAFSDESIFLDGQIDLPKKANGVAQKGEPIPVTNQLLTNTTSLVADATSSLVSDDNEPKNPSPITSSKLAELYHRFCPSLPRISDLSDQRRKAMKARWIQAGKGIDMYDIANLDAGLEWWRTFFQVVEASDFLTGRVAPSGSREKPFRANIDWLLKPSNFLKVVEGNYDNEVAK